MTFTCPIHGDYEGEMVKTLSAIFDDTDTKIPEPCPLCIDNQERDFRERERIKDEKIERDTLERQRKNWNIEPMYYDSTLDNYYPTTDVQHKAKAAIQNMIETKGGKIVLLGKNGTGKTHLAICAVKELDGKILSMYEITTRIRATYTHNAKETELDVVDELARLNMLAIDEIGRTKGSDAETNWLSYIIDKRHTRGLPLILISNKHLRKHCPKSGCQDCLDNYISEDIMSRLSEDGILINLDGEDYRKTKRVNDKLGGKA
jgi:DNA replication protein DnaC